GSHCFYNLPASAHGSHSDKKEGYKRNPNIISCKKRETLRRRHHRIRIIAANKRNVVINNCSTYDSHNFLGIVQTVSETKKCRRKQLPSLELFVCFMRIGILRNINNNKSDDDGNDHPY